MGLKLFLQEQEVPVLIILPCPDSESPSTEFSTLFQRRFIISYLLFNLDQHCLRDRLVQFHHRQMGKQSPKKSVRNSELKLEPGKPSAESRTVHLSRRPSSDATSSETLPWGTPQASSPGQKRVGPPCQLTVSPSMNQLQSSLPLQGTGRRALLGTVPIKKHCLDGHRKFRSGVKGHAQCLQRS